MVSFYIKFNTTFAIVNSHISINEISHEILDTNISLPIEHSSGVNKNN